MASINKAIDEKNNPKKKVAESKDVEKEELTPLESAKLLINKQQSA
jgi:hypothetical protein